MFKLKDWLTLLVALLFLSVTFTPALAGSLPPGNNPPPSDFAPPDPTGFSPLVEVTGAEFGMDATNPAPVAPLNNNVYTRTPKFTFTPKTDASQYHIVVVDTMATPDALVYHFYGTGSCTEFVCTMQPSNTLKTYRYEALKGGTYLWQVEAMVGGVWKGLSAAANFAVLSSGFTSTFNVDTSKWMPLSGTWTRTDKGFYKAVGSLNSVTSAMQKEFFTNDTVFEVTMKRKVEGDTFNRIIFAGVPDPLAGDSNWNTGYYFGYYNTGHWGLWRRDGGSVTYLYDDVATPFVDPFGWNTLTVWTDYPYIHMWLNGAYLGFIDDDTYVSGYVGLGMWEDDSASSPLLVDSAKLYYSAISPYAITDTALGEPLNLQVEGEGE